MSPVRIRISPRKKAPQKPTLVSLRGFGFSRDTIGGTPTVFERTCSVRHEQQRDLSEGEPKHEINELQNWLHHTDDPSKDNHTEGKIDAFQEPRQEDDDAIADKDEMTCVFLGVLSFGLSPLASQILLGRPYASNGFGTG